MLAVNLRSATRTAKLQAAIKEDIGEFERGLGKKIQETQDIAYMGILLLAKHSDDKHRVVDSLPAFAERVRAGGHGF